MSWSVHTFLFGVVIISVWKCKCLMAKSLTLAIKHDWVCAYGEIKRKDNDRKDNEGVICPFHSVICPIAICEY